MALLQELVLVLSLALAVSFAARLLRLPPLSGFLLTGVIAGPTVSGLVHSKEAIGLFAEVGVVLLLFAIGMEFSADSLLRLKRIALLGGALQLLFTTAVMWGIAIFFFPALPDGLVLGMLAALSSTALVVKLLQEQGEMTSPHGRIAVGILVFQDIAIVPLILALPLLKNPNMASLLSSLRLLLPNFALFGAAVFALWIIIPRLLDRIAALRTNELFLISVIVAVFTVALVSYKAGLSLALGSLLAGLIISDSRYSHQALGSIQPFQQLFTSFFFISVGLLFDLNFVAAHIYLVLGASAALIFVKLITAAFAVFILGFPLRTSLLSGLALAQVGELSFVVAISARDLSVLSESAYQLFLAVTVISISLTPFLLRAGAPLSSRLLPKTPKRREADDATSAKQDSPLDLLIIGFGLTGRLVAEAAVRAGLRYSVIDLNPKTVRIEAAKGRPIRFGDATQPDLLMEAGVERIKAAAVAVPDPWATSRIVGTIRNLNPRAAVIARARLLADAAPLSSLGATRVVADEYESALEVAGQVLASFLVPRNEIWDFIAESQEEAYGRLKGLSNTDPQLADLKRAAPDLEVLSRRVKPHAVLAGKTLLDSELKEDHNATLLAVKRGESVILSPPADFILTEGDLALLLGPVKDRAGLDAKFG